MLTVENSLQELGDPKLPLILSQFNDGCIGENHTRLGREPMAASINILTAEAKRSTLVLFRNC